jgi:hypothetical protein
LSPSLSSITDGINRIGHQKDEHKSQIAKDIKNLDEAGVIELVKLLRKLYSQKGLSHHYKHD